MNRQVMIVLGALTLCVPLSAQSPVARRLEHATVVTCEFPVQAVGTWGAGEPKAEIKPSALSLRFEDINADEGSARAVGRFGPSDIIVRFSFDTLHFMQSFREGPVYLTTVFPKTTRDGKLQAVHTRHEFTDVSLPGYTSRPEQYYGECLLGP